MPMKSSNRRGFLGGLCTLLAAATFAVPDRAEARACGSRGGPGGPRDKNGKCPSWRKRK